MMVNMWLVAVLGGCALVGFLLLKNKKKKQLLEAVKLAADDLSEEQKKE